MFAPTRFGLVFAFVSTAALATAPRLALAGPVPPAAVEIEPGGAADRARAALLLGLRAEDLADGRTSVRTFSALNASVTLAKAVDRATGEVHFGAFDPAGRRVDLAALELADATLLTSDPSWKLTPTLRSRLATAAPAELIEAAVWLKLDGSALDRFSAERLGAIDLKRTSSAELKEVEAEITIHVNTRVAEVVTPFVASLAGSGVSVRYASTTAPVVLVLGDAARLAALALRPEVDTIFDDGPQATDANQDANGSHRTTAVHSHGVKGNGIRVAILEDNAIDPTIPFLDVTAWFDPGGTQDTHVAGTAGCVQSSMAGRIGSAPDVELLSANAASYDDADVIAVGDWVANQDVDITNMSFGACTNTFDVKDFYFDFQSREHADSYVAAAGNTSNCTGSAFVGTPAKAYNVIACGNFVDNENSDWADDSMNAGSCWVNPTTGLNKPNVSANGTNVDTLDNIPPAYTQTASGTSFSSPHTAGNLACAMQVNSVPKAYPQAAMALMMATAWHNIEGAAAYSTVDGAGGIDGYAAYRAALNGQVEGASLVSADFDANEQHVENIWLEGDQLTRVCIAWSTEVISVPMPPQPPIYLSAPVLDLDLAILEGSNQKAGPILVASSSSTDNFEIVEFTPPVTGFYSVRIDHNGSFPQGGLEPWGLAWSQESDQNWISGAKLVVNEGILDVAKPYPGHKTSSRLLAPGFASHLYAIVPSGSAGHTVTEGGVLPIGFDVFTFTWLSLLGNPASPWQGTVGALDSNGKAVAITSLMLPPIPSLVGQDFHHVPVILGEGAQSGFAIDAIGEDDAFVTHTKPHVDGLVSNEDIQIPIFFAFEFFGQTYTSCFVNANGTITFGVPDPMPNPGVGAMLSGPPRIAVLGGGHDHVDVGISQSNAADPELQEITISFRTFDAGPMNQGNVARVTLHADGAIELEYGPCPTFDGVVGVFPGAASTATQPIDFSKNGGYLAVTHDATFESWANSVAGFDLGAPIETDAQGKQFATWRTLCFRPNPNGDGTTFRVEIEGLTDPGF